MNNTHPLDLALALCISSITSLLWIINELLGLHETAPAATTPAPITLNRDYILSLTVKQLRAYTGIKSSRYNKAALQAEALVL